MFARPPIRSLQRRFPIHKAQQCTISTFQEGDFCMLRELKSNRKYLVGPLEEGQHKDYKGGILPHSKLIGASVRSSVRTHNDAFGFMVHKPTLDEYVINVPRSCTPIYPKDASTIVQMLDIEPGHQILEAGTGNGALTLYLARAVSTQGRIHTCDIREGHSNTARKHVQRYERGRYKDAVSFHIGDVCEVAPKDVIFDGIVLDMPAPSEYIEKLLPLLRNDRFIVCYLPNMTQVLDLVRAVRDLPMVMDSCIEAEWKEWEVRATQIRSTEELAWVCRPKNFDVKGHTAFLTKLRKTE